MKQSDSLKQKIETLYSETKASLDSRKKRELSIEDPDNEVDNGDRLLQYLKSTCLKMKANEFWNSIIRKKKEIEFLREKIPSALSECIDPARFVIEVISKVFSVDKRGNNEGGGNVNDLAWACVLIPENFISVVIDSVIGKSRLLVTSSMKEKAKEIAETWKIYYKKEQKRSFVATCRMSLTTRDDVLRGKGLVGRAGKIGIQTDTFMTICDECPLYFVTNRRNVS